jgi:hypothetical protein
VPRAATKALSSQHRAAERSVETPAKRNNSSIVPSSGNSVGMKLKSNFAAHAGAGISSLIADSKSMFPAME